MNLMYDGKQWRIAETHIELSSIHDDLLKLKPSDEDREAHGDLWAKDAHMLQGRNTWNVEPEKDGKTQEVALAFSGSYADEGTVQQFYVDQGQRIGLLVDV